MTVYNKTDLTNILKENVVFVKFTKLDGNTRIMECTLNPKYLPPMSETKEEQPGRKLNDNIISVWDLEKKDWRSFRVNSIENVAVTAGE